LKKIENENEINSKTINSYAPNTINKSDELNNQIDMIFNKNTIDNAHFKSLNNLNNINNSNNYSS